MRTKASAWRRLSALLSFYAVTTLLLSGCLAAVRESYAPDGRKAYSLSCSGKYLDWNQCLNAAGRICGPLGYDVIERHSEASFEFAQNFGADFSHVRTMMIACKPPQTGEMFIVPNAVPDK